MGKTWLSYMFPGLALFGLAFGLFVELDLLPYIIIAVACVIPPVICFVAADRLPRIVLALIYLLCSAAMIWFLATEGDHLLPAGSSTGGRHAVDASGGFLAAWTGLMLVLFGIAAVLLMIADAREFRRKARLAQAPGRRPKRPR